MTPLKLKIVLALALTDAVVRDADIISVRGVIHIFSMYLTIMDYNRYLKRCTGRITAPQPTHSSNSIRRLMRLTNTFWKPVARNGCLSVDGSTMSRVPRVHCLSILAHNEK